MNQIPLFHVTDDNLVPGRVLRGRGDDYVMDWSAAPFYAALDLHRPDGKLRHQDAVFMCRLDDTDVCASGDFVALMRPVGDVHLHDMNWSGEIDALLEAGHAINSELVRLACQAYWKGEPTDGEELWEYLAEAAEVIATVPADDVEQLLDYVDTADLRI